MHQDIFKIIPGISIFISENNAQSVFLTTTFRNAIQVENTYTLYFIE